MFEITSTFDFLSTISRTKKAPLWGAFFALKIKTILTCSMQCILHRTCHKQHDHGEEKAQARIDHRENAEDQNGDTLAAAKICGLFEIRNRLNAEHKAKDRGNQADHRKNSGRDRLNKQEDTDIRENKPNC